MSSEHPGSVVVVGAGQAGCQTVTSLRQAGFAGRLVLLGAEPHQPYQRPPLSKGHLCGTVARDALWLRPAEWFAEQDIELRLATTARAIDRRRRTLRLHDGSVLSYDALVLALGSGHRRLGVAGADLPGVVSLRTLAEADDVRDRLSAAERVVVVGGGFIGMEVAATAARLGKETTVVEVADQLMGRVLSAETAAFLLAAHARRGLHVRLGTTVTAIDGTDRATGVRTTGGDVLPADLVLVGIGAVPNTAIAADAGLETGNGIVVDEFLTTSDPAVHAIGDCASFPSPFAGGARVRLESVQNAIAQARVVAAALTGSRTPYLDVPWFWSDQADLKVQIAGLTTGHDEVVVLGDLDGERFSAYCFAGGRLVGVESVNRPADHMAARRLLTRDSPVISDEVRNPAFDLKRAAAGAPTTA